MPSKSEERAVLRSVYRESDFSKIEEGERPDFAMLHRGASRPFGVEITEFFHSEADARLTKVRGYSTQLLSGGPHLHKDDRAALAVEEVTIIAPDGAPKATVKAIVQELPALREYTGLIAETIAHKSNDLAGYCTDISHVNLIVHDQGHRLITVSAERFGTLVLDDPVRTALARSGFREIFFLTKIRQDQQVYYPLKQLLLVSDLFLFNGALEVVVTQQPHLLDTAPDEITLFAWHMRQRGFNALLHSTSTGLEVLFGNSGVLVENNNVVVHDYADRPMPSGNLPQSPGPELEEAIRVGYSAFSSQHVFTLGLAYSVDTKVPIPTTGENSADG